MKKIYKKMFLWMFPNLNEREKKKTRNRNVQFKGGKPTIMDIGAHSYINGMTIYSWGESSKVVIGKYCSIADEVVLIAGGEHHQNWVSTFPFINRWNLDGYDLPSSSKGNIDIGHDVWIGHGATILSGVSIGSGAIIGAMAVVSKDVPPYAVVVGNPAKVIKYRFNEAIIKDFLKIQWWDWPDEKIENEQLLFAKPEVFVDTFN